MRALVPLGEKSSESVPVRVYAMPQKKCIENGCIRQIRISVIFYLEALCKLPNIFLLMIDVRLIICLENDIIIVK